MQGKMRRDLYAELYKVEDSHWWHQHKRAVVRMLLEQFARKGEVMDLGSGTGKILEELRRRGWQVMGIDGAKEAVAWSKKRGIKVLRVDLEQPPLPVEENRFEAVLALDLLEHLHQDVQLIKEAYRILKPGGVLIATVPAYPWLFGYWDRMLGHQRRYNREELKEKLEQQGLRLKKLSYYFCLPLFPSLLVRGVKALVKPGGKTSISDFQTTPLAFISVPVLRAYSSLERAWLSRYNLPFGLSLLLVGQKP
jgi:SAM-dependent methyltransferase